MVCSGLGSDRAQELLGRRSFSSCSGAKEPPRGGRAGIYRRRNRVAYAEQRLSCVPIPSLPGTGLAHMGYACVSVPATPGRRARAGAVARRGS